MTLLVLANNWEAWEELAMMSKEERKKKRVGKSTDLVQKFFEKGDGRGRSWNDEGREYFNSMMYKVKKDREEDGGKFDKKYLEEEMQIYAHKMLEKKSKRREKAAADRKKRVKCLNDISIQANEQPEENNEGHEKADEWTRGEPSEDIGEALRNNHYAS